MSIRVFVLAFLMGGIGSGLISAFPLAPLPRGILFGLLGTLIAVAVGKLNVQPRHKD